MLRKSIKMFFLLGLVSSSALYTMDTRVRRSKRLHEKQENNVSKRFKGEPNNKPQVLNAIVLDNVVEAGLLRLQPTMQDIKRGNIYASLEKRKQISQNVVLTSKKPKNILLTPASKVKNITITANNDLIVKKIVNPIVYTNKNYIWWYAANKNC